MAASPPGPKPPLPPSSLLADPEKLRQRYLLSLLLQPPKSKTRGR